MPDRAAADHTAKLLLWFVREPSRYRNALRRDGAPPMDTELVLKLALGRAVEFSNPGMRAADPALREAAAAYVRRVMFRPDATPYQTLGLAPGASAQQVKEKFRLLMQLVHPDRQDAPALWPEAFAARANRAYAILRDDASRAMLEGEEGERVARARATQRKAETAANTAGTGWRPAGFAARRPPPRAVLPEWLTAGVGGYLRQHPATAAFAVLLGGAALVIGSTAWDGGPGALMRAAPAPWLPPATSPARIAAGPAMARVEPGAPAAAPATADGMSVLPASPPAAGSADPQSPLGAVVPARPLTAPAERVVAGDAAGVSAANPGARAPAALDAVADPPVTVQADPRSDARPARQEAGASPAALATVSQPPSVAELDALSAAFVDAYDRGRVDAFAALFDAAAETNFYRGRAAIRGEYEELFRLSEWRRMQFRQINWRSVGERAHANGEIEVRIGWRDGREVRQRVAVDIEVARRDGRVVITRLAHQPSAP